MEVIRLWHLDSFLAVVCNPISHQALQVNFWWWWCPSYSLTLSVPSFFTLSFNILQ